MLTNSDSPSPYNKTREQFSTSNELRYRAASSQAAHRPSSRSNIRYGQTPSPELHRDVEGNRERRPGTSCSTRYGHIRDVKDSNVKRRTAQAKVDSGLPKRPKMNLLKEFSEQQMLGVLDSFSSLPTSTAEMMTMEELMRRRSDPGHSPYDALALRLIQHYTQTDPERFDREIELLRALLGLMDETSLEGLKLLPALPEDVLKVLKPQMMPLSIDEKSLSAIEMEVSNSLVLLTVRRIDALRGLNRPSLFLQKVCSAYLCLFARADKAIEVTPGFHLVLSRAWEVWQSYIKQPGHVVQIARNVVYFVKEGKVGPLELREARAVLSELRSRGSTATLAEETGLILLQFLESVDKFFREWVRQHPQKYPKRTPIDLSKSSDRLSKSISSKVTTTLPSQSQSQLSPDQIDLSLLLESPAKQANEEGVRVPSFGPGLLNAMEGSIPELDFEAVIIEPLDKAVRVDNVIEDEESTTRVKEDKGKKDILRGKNAAEMAAEWQLELVLRTVLQDRIQRHCGNLLNTSSEQLQGEAWSHSADLFQELLTTPSFFTVRDKLGKALGIESLEKLVRDLERKMKEPGFLKREIGKAVLRVKTEAERLGRQAITGGKEKQVTSPL